MKKTAMLTETNIKDLIHSLQSRFEQHPNRHVGIAWDAVAARLQQNPSALYSLSLMEYSGGEPDVIGQDLESGAFMYCDCSAESPSGRRSLCYDRAAREARKANKPVDSACSVADEMGLSLLTPTQYQYLQSLGTFDAKTSSWLATPASIRSLGGALFGDYRFGQVFIYHNGADSYYSARGFRGMLLL